MNTHTPGPWRLDDSCLGVIDKTYHAIDAGVGFLPSSGDEQGFGLTGHMTIEDARLIAAAPTLLETLQEVEAVLAEKLNRDPEPSPTYLRVRAAIAIATGASAQPKIHRLEAVNAELLEALTNLRLNVESYFGKGVSGPNWPKYLDAPMYAASSAIAKATGEQA